MFFLTTTLSLAVFVVALAIFANQKRSRDIWDFELKPNCLLTRWPVLFVTGRRSLFYFSKYWNHYPSFLAEHGYEVFTLHLPWNKALPRRQRMSEFLKARSEEGRRFHLVVDSGTLEEVKQVLSSDAYSCVMSVTEICDREKGPEVSLSAGLRVPWSPVEVQGQSSEWSCSRIVYAAHREFFSKSAPSLACLGGEKASRHENALLLLERAQILAETDLGTP